MLNTLQKKVIDSYKEALPYMTVREQEILAAQAEAIAMLADTRKTKDSIEADVDMKEE